MRTCCPAGDVSAAAATSAAAAAAAPDAPSAGLGDWACPCGRTVSSACWGRVRGSRYLGPRRGVEEGEEGWTHWYACFRSLHSRADSHTSPPCLPHPTARAAPHTTQRSSLRSFLTWFPSDVSSLASDSLACVLYINCSSESESESYLCSYK